MNNEDEPTIFNIFVFGAVIILAAWKSVEISYWFFTNIRISFGG